MKAWLRKLPLSTSGLMLGLAALGILLAPYHLGTRNLLGGSAVILLVLLTVKLLHFPESLKDSFGNPATETALAAYPMTVMLLSTFTQPAFPAAAYIAWQLSIGLSVLLMALSVRTLFRGFSIGKVYPSLFILFVGITAAGMTAPVYGMELLGKMLFWFGLIAYLPLLVLITYRVVVIRNLPEQARPSLILYAVPAALLLSGYLGSFPVRDNTVLLPLALCAILMTVYGVVQMARLMVKLSFFPTFSMFTFPFVFSALAFTSLMDHLSGTGLVSSWFVPVRTFMVLGSTFLVLYVFFQYVWYMTAAGKTEAFAEEVILYEDEDWSGNGEVLSTPDSDTAQAEESHPFDKDLPDPEQDRDSDKEDKAI